MEERPPDEDCPKNLVTITTAVTPVIVKAISTNNTVDPKTLRSPSESVLVIAPNPQVKHKIPTLQLQPSPTQPVIVKNTNAIIVQNYNRIINSSQSVIKSTKSEEWKLAWNITPNTSAYFNIKAEGDVSNDSCSVLTTDNFNIKVEADVSNDSNSILTTVSGNSMDYVMTPAGSSQTNVKTESWTESSSNNFDDNEDSRDSKTEDLSFNTSTSQKETSRDARNKAEKLRRDKLNRSINELSTLIPLVTESSRKIDKTGVLRLTAHELRKEYVFGDSMSICERDFNPGLINAFIDMLDGCLFTVTCKGIIIVISSNIEQYLGHCQTDLLGTNILALCHPDDVDVMKTNLMPHVLALGSRGQLLPNSLTGEEFSKREKQRVFHVRLARVVPRSEPQCYDTCRITGFLRRADKANTGNIPPVRRQRQRNEETLTLSGNDVVFVGLIHPLKKQQLCQRLFEASKEEYKTRHLTDGRIVCCDQRISVVAGYLTSEINGMSGFTFMHKDDVRWVIIALRQMYDRSKQCGESCYRLVTKSGELIYMRTAGFLEIGSDNNVQSFICVNTRLSDDEGKYCINKMKRKYEVVFDGMEDFINLGSPGDGPIEDPVKLEQAIVHLITNLPSAANHEHVKDGENPPLSIITPQISTVKLSIEKSYSVLGKLFKSKAKKENVVEQPQSPAETVKESAIPTIEEFSSNDYLTDVIDKMDLFSEKKSNVELPTYFTDPLSRLVEEENLNKPANSPKIYHRFPVNAEETKMPFNLLNTNVTPISTNFMQDISLPSTSSSVTNIQSDNLYAFDLSDPTFGIHSFPFIKNEHDSKSSQNSEGNHKSETVNSGDPLIGSIINTHDELDKLVTQAPYGGQKRSMIDRDDTTISKRKITIPMSHNSNMMGACDTMFPTTFSDNIARDNDGVTEGFDHFIDELTNPTSDLGIVVPRSLVALESSITDLDDTVNHINPIYPEETHNYTEIMDHHSQNKNILENIQNEHKTSNIGQMLIKRDPDDEF